MSSWTSELEAAGVCKWELGWSTAVSRSSCRLCLRQCALCSRSSSMRTRQAVAAAVVVAAEWAAAVAAAAAAAAADFRCRRLSCLLFFFFLFFFCLWWRFSALVVISRACFWVLVRKDFSAMAVNLSSSSSRFSSASVQAAVSLDSGPCPSSLFCAVVRERTAVHSSGVISLVRYSLSKLGRPMR